MIYFSIDIETNGLCAGINSMLSLGCAAIDMDTGQIAGTFKQNLTPLYDLVADCDTMEWWKQFPDAYKASTEDAAHPCGAMFLFKWWVEGFNQVQPVCAAWKPGFDIAFLRYYLFRFCGGDIFGRSGSGLDIKTLTAAALNQPFSETQIAKVPREWTGSMAEHNHDALDDAIEQAHVLYHARKKLGVNV